MKDYAHNLAEAEMSRRTLALRRIYLTYRWDACAGGLLVCFMIAAFEGAHWWSKVLHG